nr:hypothetical protein [Tanacetum cinerariifolium]
MEQYMSKTRANYGSGISRPKIDDKDRFELKGQFLKELRDNTFSSSDHEDANEHIEKVLEIVDLFHIPNIIQYQVMLRAFFMSLTGVASRWLRNKPYGSITTWEDLKTKFLSKYCPLARTIKKIKINNFQQETDETFYQAWERFKELLMKLNSLGREIKKVIEKVYDAQIGCEQCKRPHYTKDYLLKEEDFIILDIPKDVKVPLILERPFLSTAHAKIDVFKRKIILRVGDEKIIFESVKPASSLIKRVYLLGLRERMELDLEARLMGDTLVLNRPLDPLYGDYIKLNDLNVPLERKRDQVDYLIPTIKEVVENIDGYRDQDMGDIILREPFCKASCVKARRELIEGSQKCVSFDVKLSLKTIAGNSVSTDLRS